ncbi:hypothetical protein EK904_010623 [Melospiza melodia maxima]|nr:hypothetical protein EK904_010623 [Melospiza melodia maxima]
MSRDYSMKTFLKTTVMQKSLKEVYILSSLKIPHLIERGILCESDAIESNPEKEISAQKKFSFYVQTGIVLCSPCVL